MNKNFWDLISKTNETGPSGINFSLFDGPRKTDLGELESIEITITKNIFSTKPAWLLFLEVRIRFLKSTICFDFRLV